MIDTVITDTDEITADNRNSALHRIEVDEDRFARHRGLQRNVRAVRYLPYTGIIG